MHRLIALTLAIGSAAVFALPVPSTGELAETYAALILADEGVDITVRKLSFPICT